MRILKLELENCVPCKTVQKYFDEAGVAVENIDVSEHPEIAAKYMIVSVPSVILLDKDGEEVARAVGFNRTQLDNIINSYVP